MEGSVIDFQAWVVSSSLGEADAAGSDHTNLPHVKQRSGAEDLFEDCGKLLQKITGVLLFGAAGGIDVLFRSYGWVPAGANLACTCIWLALFAYQDAERLRRHVIWQSDGGAGDFWNKTVVALWAHLIIWNCFDTVTMKRMRTEQTSSRACGRAVRDNERRDAAQLYHAVTVGCSGETRVATACGRSIYAGRPS